MPAATSSVDIVPTGSRPSGCPRPMRWGWFRRNRLRFDKEMCEWRLGRQKLGDPDEEPGAPIAVFAFGRVPQGAFRSPSAYGVRKRPEGLLDFVSQYIR